MVCINQFLVGGFFRSRIFLFVRYCNVSVFWCRFSRKISISLFILLWSKMTSSLSKEPLKITRVNVIKFKCVNFFLKKSSSEICMSQQAPCVMWHVLCVWLTKYSPVKFTHDKYWYKMCIPKSQPVLFCTHIACMHVLWMKTFYEKSVYYLI